MPYLEASDIEALLESDESVGDEGWDRESSDEATPTYRRTYSGRGGVNVPRINPARGVGGLTGVSLNTPAGRADVRFEKPVATKESVDALAKELKAELKAQSEAIKKVDQTVDKNTAILDKKLAAVTSTVKKGQESSSMSMLLPMLLSKPPKINSITVAPPVVAGPGTLQFAVKDATLVQDNSSMLMIALLAGGLGGGSGDSSNTLLLALALTGGFGSK
jgi:hypothetical protein